MLGFKTYFAGILLSFLVLGVVFGVEYGIPADSDNYFDWAYDPMIKWKDAQDYCQSIDRTLIFFTPYLRDYYTATLLYNEWVDPELDRQIIIWTLNKVLHSSIVIRKPYTYEDFPTDNFLYPDDDLLCVIAIFDGTTNLTLWSAIECDTDLVYDFMCKKKDPITEGYFHKFFNEPVNWYTADSYCQKQGGSLVTVKNTRFRTFEYFYLFKELMASDMGDVTFWMRFRLASDDDLCGFAMAIDGYSVVHTGSCSNAAHGILCEYDKTNERWGYFFTMNNKRFVDGDIRYIENFNGNRNQCEAACLNEMNYGIPCFAYHFKNSSECTTYILFGVINTTKTRHHYTTNADPEYLAAFMFFTRLELAEYIPFDTEVQNPADNTAAGIYTTDTVTVDTSTDKNSLSEKYSANGGLAGLTMASIGAVSFLTTVAQLVIAIKAKNRHKAEEVNKDIAESSEDDTNEMAEGTSSENLEKSATKSFNDTSEDNTITEGIDEEHAERENLDRDNTVPTKDDTLKRFGRLPKREVRSKGIFDGPFLKTEAESAERDHATTRGHTSPKRGDRLPTRGMNEARINDRSISKAEVETSERNHASPRGHRSPKRGYRLPMRGMNETGMHDGSFSRPEDVTSDRNHGTSRGYKTPKGHRLLTSDLKSTEINEDAITKPEVNTSVGTPDASTRWFPVPNSDITPTERYPKAPKMLIQQPEDFIMHQHAQTNQSEW